jgi:hypothetical protein
MQNGVIFGKTGFVVAYDLRWKTFGFVKIYLRYQNLSTQNFLSEFTKIWIRQIQNRKRTLFRFSILMKKYKNYPRRTTILGAPAVPYAIYAKPARRTFSLFHFPHGLFHFSSSSSLPPSGHLLFSSTFPPLLPSYPSNPSLRRAPPQATHRSTSSSYSPQHLLKLSHRSTSSSYSPASTSSSISPASTSSSITSSHPHNHRRPHRQPPPLSKQMTTVAAVHLQGTT